MACAKFTLNFTYLFDLSRFCLWRSYCLLPAPISLLYLLAIPGFSGFNRGAKMVFIITIFK